MHYSSIEGNVLPQNDPDKCARRGKNHSRIVAQCISDKTKNQNSDDRAPQPLRCDTRKDIRIGLWWMGHRTHTLGYSSCKIRLMIGVVLNRNPFVMDPRAEITRLDGITLRMSRASAV